MAKTHAEIEAYVVEELIQGNHSTKAAIAREFDISPRTVTRIQDRNDSLILNERRNRKVTDLKKAKETVERFKSESAPKKKETTDKSTTKKSKFCALNSRLHPLTTAAAIAAFSIGSAVLNVSYLEGKLDNFLTKAKNYTMSIASSLRSFSDKGSLWMDNALSPKTPAIETEQLEYTPILPKEGIEYVIDPGHGGIKGENVGTTILGGPLERDYVLGIADSLDFLLESQNYTSKKTREGINPNLRLSNRSEMVDATIDGVLVSLHVNGSENKNTHGSVVYYQNGDEDSRKLAEYIAGSLLPIFGKARIAIRLNRQGDDYYFILRETDKTAVLVELGFGGSNKKDAQILLRDQQKIVKSLAHALNEYSTQYKPGFVELPPKLE